MEKWKNKIITVGTAIIGIKWEKIITWNCKSKNLQNRNKYKDYSFQILFFVFLGLHPGHMEVSRLGIESELQLSAYTRATAMLDPSHICDLHHSSGQCPNPKPTEWGQELNPCPHGH